MKTTSSLGTSAIAIMITIVFSPLAWQPSEPIHPAVTEAAYQVDRPSDGIASCRALYAEISQISTEVELQVIAQANSAPSNAANNRLQRLQQLLSQRNCPAGRNPSTWS